MLGEAFWKGYDAFYAGVPISACPYPEGSLKASEWRRGWGDEDVTEVPIGQSQPGNAASIPYHNS